LPGRDHSPDEAERTKGSAVRAGGGGGGAASSGQVPGCRGREGADPGAGAAAARSRVGSSRPSGSGDSCGRCWRARAVQCPASAFSLCRAFCGRLMRDGHVAPLAPGARPRAAPRAGLEQAARKPRACFLGDQGRGACEGETLTGRPARRRCGAWTAHGRRSARRGRPSARRAARAWSGCRRPSSGAAPRPRRPPCSSPRWPSAPPQPTRHAQAPAPPGEEHGRSAPPDVYGLFDRAVPP